MLIIFDLSTHEIIGVSAITINTKSEYGEPTLKSCYPYKKIIPNVSAISVQNDERIANELYRYQIRFNRAGDPVGLELKPPMPYIELSIDLPPGNKSRTPQIKADGKSKAVIIATIRDHTGNILNNHGQKIFFKTTGGRLKSRTEISENGVAKNLFQSVKETKTVTISATAIGYQPGKLDLDLV
jgi:hypothetical protein